MEKIKTQLDNIRLAIKEDICDTLISIFKHFNNGQLPNYEDEENILVEASLIKLHLLITVEVSDIYGTETAVEKWGIDEYLVTLDLNLYFECNDNEIEWTEISTDELYRIAFKLNEVLKKL
jgi:hypothetical protein